MVPDQLVTVIAHVRIHREHDALSLGQPGRQGNRRATFPGAKFNDCWGVDLFRNGEDSAIQSPCLTREKPTLDPLQAGRQLVWGSH